MRRSTVGKSKPVAVLLIACCVAVGGCRDERGSPGPDPNEPVGHANAIGDSPQSLADLNAIVESNRPDDGSALQQQAIQLIREGDTLGAERRMLGRVAEAEAQFGSSSAQLAWAQFDLASIYLVVGEVPKAIRALREACKIDVPGDTQAAKDRLTFMMNLGEVLDLSDQMEEAEQVLRDGLAQREALYGRDHPGYAYGLEPLASVLLKGGKLEEALVLADEAVENYTQNAHPAAVTAMALRAEIVKTANSERSAFDGQETLTDTSFADLANSVISRLSLDKAEVGRRLLNDLIPISTRRLGENHEQTIALLVAMTNMERTLGDHEERARIFRRLLDAYDARGESIQAIEALKGLAIAQSDGGKDAEADRTYEVALKRAQELGDPVIESDVLRNHGLYLAEIERIDDARERLEASLGQAQSTSDRHLLGVAQVSLGIFYQHQGELDRARELLSTALNSLDPMTSDALCGRSHLTAIETGADCGCSETTMAHAINQAVREYVLSRAPEGLIDDVAVRRDEDGSLSVQIESARQPTAEEQDELNRIIDHALTNFRIEAERGTYSPAYRRLRER